VSERYDLAIAGTKDGALVLVSLSRLSMVRSVELGSVIPRKIEVTAAWGFVVTYGEEIVAGAVRHYLLVHTVNGAFVRKAELVSGLDCWCFWASWDGFDFLASASDTGKIDVCEVYHVNERRSVYNCQAKIIVLYYSKSHGFVVAASAAGQLFFIPCLPP
jgi:hypothetical protein